VVKFFIALVLEEELVSIVSNRMVSRGMGKKRSIGIYIEDLMARIQCKHFNDCKFWWITKKKLVS